MCPAISGTFTSFKNIFMDILMKIMYFVFFMSFQSNMYYEAHYIYIYI